MYQNMVAAIRAASAPGRDADAHGINAIATFKQHIDMVVFVCANFSAHIIGANWQLAVASINQGEQFHRGWPAIIEKRLQSRAHCSACKKNIVHEDDSKIIQAAGHG